MILDQSIIKIIANTQMTIGELIQELEKIENKGQGVFFDFEEAFPTDFESWRGYYCHLALCFDLGGYNMKKQGTTPQSVEQLLQKARSAASGIFGGWKGGLYQMDDNTPVWIANTGNGGCTALIGVLERRDFNYILLLTGFKERKSYE